MIKIFSVSMEAIFTVLLFLSLFASSSALISSKFSLDRRKFTASRLPIKEYHVKTIHRQMLHSGGGSETEDNLDDYDDSQLQDEEEDPTSFKCIGISGFASKANGFSSILPFDFYHEHPGFCRDIVCITDDVSFARKRFSSPKTVYNGFIDKVDIREAPSDALDDYKRALTGVDGWIAFNVSSSKLDHYADIAIQSQIKRILFAVPVNKDECGPNLNFPETTAKLAANGIKYTLIKYIQPSKSREGPYRIVRGETPIPRPGAWNEHTTLSATDLYDIIAFLLPNPAAFNQVYGVGVGNSIDENAMAHMRSRGWVKAVQVNQFIHRFMEDVEAEIIEQITRKEAEATSASFRNSPLFQKKTETHPSYR